MVEIPLFNQFLNKNEKNKYNTNKFQIPVKKSIVQFYQLPELRCFFPQDKLNIDAMYLN